MDETAAMVKAAELTEVTGLHFCHFVEAIVRLCLKRYGATVPEAILHSWNEEQFNYTMNAMGLEGYDSDGSGKTEFSSVPASNNANGNGNGASMRGRRLSRSIRRSIGPKRPPDRDRDRDDDNQSSRGSLAPSIAMQSRRLSSSMNRRKSSGFEYSQMQSRENTRIANTATRVRFALETHFLGNGGVIGGSGGGGGDDELDSQLENYLLRLYRGRLEKIFSHFGVEHSDKKLMDIGELVFFLDSVGLVNEKNFKCSDVDVIDVCLSSLKFMGLKDFDLIEFRKWFKTLVMIAEFKTFDGVTDKKTRYKSFFARLFEVVGKKTKINTQLW